MTTWRRLAAALAALTAATAVTGCGDGDESGDGGDRTLTVLAAASLTDVFGKLAAEFEAEHDGVEVELSLGSSTDLAEQAADGAPGDVLATADATSMEVAEDAGVTGTVATFAENVVVLAVPPGNPAGVRSLADLDGLTWVRCADDVPCGRAALALLEREGVPDEPASLEEDVRSTLDKVVSGEAEAGLVYATDAVAAAGEVVAVEVDGAADLPTTYAVATLEQAGEGDLAEAWVDLLTSEQGCSALVDAGFVVP